MKILIFSLFLSLHASAASLIFDTTGKDLGTVAENTEVTSIDVAGNPTLENLQIVNCPNLTEITFSGDFSELCLKVVDEGQAILPRTVSISTKFPSL